MMVEWTIVKVGEISRPSNGWRTDSVCLDVDWGGRREERGFTLIEILVAVTLFSLVLLGIHAVFHSSLRLHDKVVDSIEAALPGYFALSVIKQDLQQLVAPGPNAVLVSPLQTPSMGENAFFVGFEGRAVSPEFYTASGVISDDLPWGNVRRVAYFVGSTNGVPGGTQLIRAVWRNLLPVLTENPEVEVLMDGVRDVVFEFYDGMQWSTYWDASVQARPLPYAIRVQIELVNTNPLVSQPRTITMVLPVHVDGYGTNSAESSLVGQ